MKFVVLDNKRPAILSGNQGWSNCRFNTFSEALEYAKDWLGEFDCIPPNLTEDDLPYTEDYSGYGDTISIMVTK